VLVNEEKTRKIINAGREVHNELGNGFLEPIYQEALEEEFKIQNIPYEREKLLTVVYKGKKLNKEYYADFVCYGNIIVELKAVSLLSKPHKAQVLNYLNAANMEIGLLINFGQTSLKWERITKFIKRNVVDISNPCGNSKGEN
jgi:GxxExxY protein